MQLLVDRQIERANRNLLLTSLGLLGLLVLAGVLSGRYYHNYFAGPFASTLDELAQAGTRPERYFVRVEGELLDTGYQHVTRTVDKRSQQEKSRKVDAAYLAVQQGERTLLVKAPVGTEGPAIAGWLDRPGSVEQEILGALQEEEPALARSLVPVFLDATATRTGGTLGLAAAAILLAICLRNLRAWSSRRARRENHPIWKRLAKLGEARSLAAQIDMEARDPGAARFKGGVTVTPSWLLHESLYGLTLVPTARVAWIHKKVTAHKQLFITVGKTFQAVVNDRDGNAVTVNGSEAEVDRLLGELLRRAPWALAGWSAELEKAWSSRRQEVIAAVDARREQQGRAAGGGAA